jgi:hypothetical protein
MEVDNNYNFQYFGRFRIDRSVFCFIQEITSLEKNESLTKIDYAF